MKLTILGSNSAGNGYIIQNQNEALILECGMKFQDAQKALNFNTSKVVGVLVSHEHGDHCKYVKDYTARGLQVFSSFGTLEAINRRHSKTVGLQRVMKHGDVFRIGNFKVMPFNLKHDCAEPVGFFINHPEMGTLIFATDTYYLEATFEGVNHWLIECNYRKDILDKNCPKGNWLKKTMRDRTLESHMSFETCKNALKANDLSQTQNIVLIHLSDNNSNAAEFKRDIEKETGKMTHIAQKGLEINLSKYQF